MSHPERIVPDTELPGVVSIHLKRYEFALPFCEGNAVLDAACGVGYGSAFLASAAASVVGIDVDPKTVAYAKERYAGTNCSFDVMNTERLGFADESFDTVCSFETIEHVDDPTAAIASFHRVLKPGGTLIISTPHVTVTTREPSNPFHKIEFSRADFSALLHERFADVELYGQRRVQTSAHRLAQRLDIFGLRRHLHFLRRGARLLGTNATEDLGLDGLAIERDNFTGATEIIAVCRR